MSNSHPAEFNPSVGATSIHFGNHLELVRQLLILADECLLVSPFLFKDFSPLFEGLSLESLNVELISTCASRGDDQLTKPFSLKSFGCILETLTGNWPTINLVNNLHSKVYIFWKNGVPFAGLVTSANLTRSGLSLNHETGILLSKKELLAELAQRARQTLDYVSLSEYQLEKLCAVAEIYIRDRGPDNVREEIGLTNLLELYATPSAGNRNTKLRESAGYFIKVSGVRDRPILPEERRPFDEPHGELTFAKNPKSIDLGDCLIEVAVGGRCFLSYYACASAVYERTDEEKREDADSKRWPFYVYANNLSLHYGASWFDEPIYYDDVVADFKAENPLVPVTSAGKDHFVGAIQMGHSYISVTTEFGEYVRKRIDEFPANNAMTGAR